MTRARTPVEREIGNLIVAVQQEWMRHGGVDGVWQESEHVMHRSHELLIHAKTENLPSFLEGRTVAQFLGESWLKHHPQIMRFVKPIEKFARQAI
ncbi:MAG: hypothetical protein ABIW82_02655 [Dokdonella sp.]